MSEIETMNLNVTDKDIREAYRLNEAYDTVVNGGKVGDLESDYTPDPYGTGYAMNSETRTYSVQPPAANVGPHPDTNVATVASQLSNPDYAHGYRYQLRHTFAAHNQERAQELILALDIKKGQRLIERRREARVKAGKKTLGIGGVRIPKV